MNYIFTHIDEKFIQEILSFNSFNMEQGSIIKGAESKHRERDSKISWIDNKKIRKKTLDATIHICKKYKWLVSLDAIEHLQYSEYGQEGKYDWHTDSFNFVPDYAKKYNGRMRKVSFCIFLNSDFSGGEFDLEIKGPGVPGERYISFTKTENNILFFPSYTWHRVRPVKSGVRKSIVGWVLGPP